MICILVSGSDCNDVHNDSPDTESRFAMTVDVCTGFDWQLTPEFLDLPSGSPVYHSTIQIWMEERRKFGLSLFASVPFK